MILQRYTGIVMLFRVLAVAAAVTALAPYEVQARTIDQSQGPAELPPASFKGNQFVDSSGCIFMRAGFGSQVTWVPRVTRSRSLLCGYKPTFAANQTRPNDSGSVSMSMPLAPSKPSPEPKTTAASAPAPVPAAPTASDDTSRMLSASAKPGVSGGMSYAAAPAAKPDRSYVATAAPAQGPSVSGEPVRLVSKSQCAGYAPEVSHVYKLSDGRSVIRCAPGSNDYLVVRVVDQAPSTAVAAASVPQGGAMVADRVTGNVPIAPPAPMYPYRGEEATQTNASAYRSSAAQAGMPRDYSARSTQGWVAGGTNGDTSDGVSVIPKGYKRAWTDGRLNPLRGPRTAEGNAQMDLVWTRTVPRHLINTRTMRDVGAQYPALSYPQTASVPQATGGVPTRYRTQRMSQATPRVTASLSTSNAAQAAAPVAGQSYVQVGTYGVASNASHTAARLRSMGYPVAMGRMTTHGRVLQTVMAGPFASGSQLSAALARVRQAGFSDAYIR